MVKSFISLGIVIMLFSISFITIWINQPVNSIFYIDEVRFELGVEKRTIETYVKVLKGTVEPKRFFINNENVSKWKIENNSRLVREGQKLKCILEYHWEMSEFYVIDLLTSNGQLASTGRLLSPSVDLFLTLMIKDFTVAFINSSIQINTMYESCAKGIDLLDVLLFTYLSFNKTDRDLVIFYDPDYMHDNALSRANVIIDYFNKFNVAMRKLRFDDLADLEIMQNSVFILINPLKDKFGNKIENAVPASIMDPNNNGCLKDDSKYGKSFLYDLMKDNGLIFVIVGSLQPHKKILYKNGTYVCTLDSFEPFDAHNFFTDASKAESIIKGNFGVGGYIPVRISSTLRIIKREASFGFDKDCLDKFGAKYYAYGDYKLFCNGRNLNLTLPVFIKVGKGGLLFMGDDEYVLTNEQIAHELFFVYLQSIWDSQWIPYGWYWDSGSDHHACSGILSIAENVETEHIPSNLVGKQIVIRIIGIAYSYDLKRGVVLEERIAYEVP